MNQTKIKPIALYLPQYHPIPENDEWWGKGFTEWTNVTKAKPLFNGHYQPHLPADLGFYDLRLPETRQAQADLARTHGIHGFCYYHYWFKGKRLLEHPVNELMQSGSPDFPFCLCWANETWSRRWLGEEKEILIRQEYSDEDDIDHAIYLAQLFGDKRYVSVDQRPLFIIYRPGDLPNPVKTIEVIKEACLKRNGVEPFLVGSNAHSNAKADLLNAGFDAILNFRPQLGALPFAFGDQFSLGRLLKNLRTHHILSGTLKIYSYREALERMQQLEPETYDQMIPVVFAGWDNTARRGSNGIIMTDNTVELFKQEILRVIDKLKRSDDNPGLIFINAWNEWAEGNHIEPDQKNGLAYLNCILSLQTT